MTPRKCARCGKTFRKNKTFPLGGPVFHYRDQSWPSGIHVYSHGNCKGPSDGDGFQHPLQPAALDEAFKEKVGLKGTNSR